jgi:hypothetical protein
MQEHTVKHLEFIQAIITRLAGNSFLLKGWTVTLAAALFALSANDTNPSFALIALFPALAFWGLDAYYLRQERLFRKLYEDLLKSMSQDTEPIAPFSMSVGRYLDQVPSWSQTLRAPTVAALHGTVVVTISIVSGVLFVLR